MARTSNCPHRKKKKNNVASFISIHWNNLDLSDWEQAVAHGEGLPTQLLSFESFPYWFLYGRSIPLLYHFLLPKAQRELSATNKIKKWPSQYHRSKSDCHEKHWASFIPYTEHPLSQVWEYSAWWGMVETELRSTDEIHLGRRLLSHR